MLERNAEARLIESRAEEALVRGLRLSAVGRTAHPEVRPPEAPDTPPSRGRRRVHLGGEWVEAEVVEVADLIDQAMPVNGPAVVELPFSSLVLRPGDVARALPSGVILVDIAY